MSVLAYPSWCTQFAGQPDAGVATVVATPAWGSG
jgi:hypothetical protein